MLLYVMHALLYARTLEKTVRFDVCHAHFILPTGLVAYLLCRLYGVPYIVTSHGSDVIGFDPRFRLVYPFLRPFWHLVAGRAARLTAPSSYLCGRIEQERDQASCEVVYNGIDPTVITPLEKERYIVVTARAVRGKGIEDIIRAIKDMPLNGWGVKIVGDGKHFDELRELCDDVGASRHVEFLGWLNNRSEHYHRLIGHAAIFLSTSHLESFSVSVLEAMQAGCTLVLSDIPPFLELFPHASFFSTGDPASLRTALRDAMDAYDAGRRELHDTTQYHWHRIGARYLTLLEQAVA